MQYLALPTKDTINGHISPTAELSREWERWADDIERNLYQLNGTCSMEGLYTQACRGVIMFWSSPKAWAFSSILHHETCKSMNVFLAGGPDGGLLDELLPVIEKLSRELHCKFIHMDVRRGFIRRGDHSARGYKELTVCVGKDLTDG